MLNKKSCGRFRIITIIIFLLIDIPLIIYLFNLSLKNPLKPTICTILDYRVDRYTNLHLHLTANISDLHYENWVRANDRVYHGETEKIDCYYREGKTDSLRLWQPITKEDIIFIVCLSGQIILFIIIVGIPNIYCEIWKEKTLVKLKELDPYRRPEYLPLTQIQR